MLSFSHAYSGVTLQTNVSEWPVKNISILLANREVRSQVIVQFQLIVKMKTIDSINC